jgi:hypothetical protein
MGAHHASSVGRSNGNDWHGGGGGSVPSFRFGTGGPIGEKMTTIAGGAGGVLQVRRIQPFGRLLVGYSHLSSNDNIYLAGGPQSGFATMFGMGLDVGINEQWGVRPFYTERSICRSDRAAVPTGISELGWFTALGILVAENEADRHRTTKSSSTPV